MPCWVTAAGSAECACKSQLASLLACQMPLKLGLPSMRAVLPAGDWPVVGVIDMPMRAPSAAAVTATTIMEPERRSNMRSPPCTMGLLVQRIEGGTPRCIVLRQRIRPASLRKLAVFLARRLEHRGIAYISFNAARLVINPVCLFVLLGELLRDSPGTSPNRRILDRHDVLNRGRGGTGPALDQVQILARAPVVGFRTEVRHVNHQRITLPMAA